MGTQDKKTDNEVLGADLSALGTMQKDDDPLVLELSNVSKEHEQGLMKLLKDKVAKVCDDYFFVKHVEKAVKRCNICSKVPSVAYLLSNLSTVVYACKEHSADVSKSIFLDREDVVKKVASLTNYVGDLCDCTINQFEVAPTAQVAAVLKDVCVASDASFSELLNSDEGANEEDWSWYATWKTLYPATGRGRFMYQHHFQYLDDSQLALSHMALVDRDGPVHGDLRLEADASLGGFKISINAQRVAEGADMFMAMDGETKIHVDPKSAHSKAWLTTTDGFEICAEYGRGKMFNLDDGTYVMGVRTRTMSEIFLQGAKLNGRYVIKYGLLEDNMQWYITKPDNQTPLAETLGIETFAERLKDAGHTHFIWAGPGLAPQVVDVATGLVAIEKGTYLRLTKREHTQDEQLVTGVVMEPGTLDTHGDTISVEEVKAAAHGFLDASRVLGVQHVSTANAIVAESYLAHEDTMLGGEPVLKGSWILVTKVLDVDLWDKIKNLEYTGYSIGALGIRLDDV